MTATAMCERLACPWCGASPGRRCQTPSGVPVRPGKWHDQRVAAWAARNDDREAVAK